MEHAAANNKLMIHVGYKILHLQQDKLTKLALYFHKIGGKINQSIYSLITEMSKRTSTCETNTKQ